MPARKLLFAATVVASLVARSDAGFATPSLPTSPRWSFSAQRPAAVPLHKEPQTAAAVPLQQSSALPSTYLQSALPAVAYGTLGGLSIAAGYFIQPLLAWKGVALIAGCIGLPMASLLFQVQSLGGAGIAKSLGGAPAPARIVALANDAAKAVGAPPPKYVYLIDKREPNALATGLRSSDATVAVTQGLVDILSANELRAVLAHEMGHLLHDDVSRNLHVAIAAVGLGGVYEAGRYVLDASSRSSSRSSKKDKKDGDGLAGTGLMLMGAGLAAQGVAHLLRLGASRTAELRADAAAAAAFGANSLISALEKIHRYGANASDLRESATGRLYAFAMISDGDPGAPAKAETQEGAPVGFYGRAKSAMRYATNMLRTHPQLDERVASLEDLVAAGTVRR